MALQDYLVNIGQSANDKAGDPLRVAFEKINGALTELYGTDLVSTYQVGDDTQFVRIELDGEGVPTGGITIQSGYDTSMPVYIKGGNASQDGVGGNVIIEAGAPPLATPDQLIQGSGPYAGTVGNIEMAANQTSIDSLGKMWTFDGDGTVTFPNGETLLSQTNQLYFHKADGDTFGEIVLQAGGVGFVASEPISTGSLEVGTTAVAITANDNQWTFAAKGTLQVPHLLPKTFTAVLDEAHADSPITLNGTPWQFEVQWQVNPDGTVETMLENIFPRLDNPGYVTGNSFTFVDTETGIPGYTFTVELNDVILPGGAGWTANLAVPPPPTYTPTLESEGAIKLTSNEHSWTFTTNGKLKLPAGGDIVNSSGVSVLGGGGGNSFSSITMTSTPNNGSSNTIQYGMGDFIAYKDGDIWALGEWDGTNFGQQGIRFNPGIEGNSELVLPADPDAATTPVMLANYAGNVQIQAININVQANNDINIKNNGNTNVWNFSTSGALTLAGDLTAKTIPQVGHHIGGVPYDNIGSAGPNDILIYGNTPATTEVPTWGDLTGYTFEQDNGPGGPFTTTITGMRPDLANSAFTIADPMPNYAPGITFSITSPNYVPTQYYNLDINAGTNAWTFDTYGNLTVPGDIFAQSTNDLNIRVTNPDALGGASFTVENYQNEIDGPTTKFAIDPTFISLFTDYCNIRNEWKFDDGGILTLPYNNYVETSNINMTLGSQGNVRIMSDAAGSGHQYTWTFDNTGLLTLPTNGKIKDANNYLTVENINIQGSIKDVSGTTGSTGQVLSRASNGGVEWINNTASTDRITTGGKTLSIDTNGVLAFPSNTLDTGGPAFTIKSQNSVTVNPGSNSWIFGINGTLTLADTTSQLFTTSNGVTLTSPNKRIRLISQDSTSSGSAQVYVKSATASVDIITNADGANAKTWTFSNDGKLTTPGDIVGYPTTNIHGDVLNESVTINPSATISKPFTFYINESSGVWTSAGFQLPQAITDKQVNINFQHNNGTGGFIFNQGADTTGSTQLNNAFNIKMGGDIKISTWSGATGKVWKFATDGSLTFPDSSIQTTAFVDTPVNGRYHVNPQHGNNTTGTGSINYPFATVAGAQAYIEDQIANHGLPTGEVNPIFIVIQGDLTENITLTRGHVFLTSDYGTIHTPIYLYGTITVSGSATGDGAIDANHFGINGLAIVADPQKACVYFTGSNAQRLFVTNLWLTARGNQTGNTPFTDAGGYGIYADCTGYRSSDNKNSVIHGSDVKVSHTGTGDVYCFQIGTAAGTSRVSMDLSSVETSGATQVGAVATGCLMAFANSTLDASNEVVVEAYGTGAISLNNCSVTNTNVTSDAYGIWLHSAGGNALLINTIIDVYSSATNSRAIKGVAGTAVFYNNIIIGKATTFPFADHNKKIDSAVSLAPLTTSLTPV